MVKCYSLEDRKLEGETNFEFVRRLVAIKDELKLSWREITDLANQETGWTYSASWYYKTFHDGGDSCDIGTVTTCASSLDQYDELLELRKAKIKASDERIQTNAYVRRLAREETIKEIAADYASKMTEKQPLQFTEHPYCNSETDKLVKEGILLLSDWHYGMVCDNPWNQFDPEICKARIGKLLDAVIARVHEQNVYKITVLNLSDLIAGRIHTQIRIESRYDVITQTMDVSEILANFLNQLSQHCYIDYYDCLDNHSRLEPNKKESLDLETLVRIIPWYLRERLADNKSITICDNEFGADIITCNVMGHNIIGVHGDNDSPVSALEKLSLMTHRHYDMLCTAHRHHFNCDEKNQSIVISNSSLMGVDSYAEKLRLTSDPSQTLVIVTPENVCDCIYRVVLK